ncbi:MAG: DUF5060 domain-containing protein [Saprospiraceae bacterium]|nr:DUF5060 domain-containing protein [Saprospiraceae bacterium]
MKKLLTPGFRSFLPLLTILLMLPTNSQAQAPEIDSVSVQSYQVPQGGKFECTVYLKTAVSNPYDYDLASIQGTFTGPNGQSVTVDGFFMQDHSLNTSTGALTPLGNGQFKIRFCPLLAGNWTFFVTANTSGGTATTNTQNFTCKTAATKGFVRRNNSRYFQFDNGEQYIPIGQNVCWQNNNIYLDYKNWLGDMAANKANFFRLWMAHWGLGIEWKNGSSGFAGLKKYKQSAAFYLDWMLDYCAQNNLYMMLCINHHGQYSSTINPNWNENPYSSLLGGPLNQPQQFFSNATAKALHKNRLRYIVARWGYSTNLQCWELFNEVDLTENFDANAANVVSWHDEMSTYLKSIDPYQHLVSTSGSKPSAFDDIWELSAMDFTQEHIYRNVANIEVPIAETARALLTNFDKPALIGEFGLSGSGTQTAVDDPSGIHFHNGMWAGLFSGSAGTAMTWWWDNYVEPKNLYPHFAPLAAVAGQLAFASDQYQPVLPSVNGGPASDASFSPVAGWGSATAAQFTVDASGNINPGVTQLGQFLYGASWNTQYRNPPSFTVTFPTASKFRVRTGANTSQAPTVVISLDGVQKLNQNGQINTVYSIDVPAGTHTIKVDNLGTDWIEIMEYVFEKLGTSVQAFTLKAGNSQKTAGWMHQKTYNWQYLKANGAPAAAAGVSVTIPGMAPGTYSLNWWNCATGTVLQTSTASADAAGNLVLPCPAFQWDLAFTAVAETVGAPEVAAAETAEETFYPSPAPAGGPFFWSAEQAEPGPWMARLFNAQGQLVRQESIVVSEDAPVALSGAGLPGGLYVVVLEKDARVRRGKVLLGLD